MSAAALADAAPGTACERASRDRVDVWRVVLEPRAIEAALSTLSESEREHAARLRAGAAHWVAARAALRRVIGRYLGTAPDEVAIASGATGKPRLVPGAGPDLRFNLSHSGNIVLIAVRLGHDVGIDVEERRPDVDGPAIARDVFTARERAALEASTAADGAQAFFRSWVRREALAKATGLGILSRSSPVESARFTVRDLDGIPGFAAALASEGGEWSVRQFTAHGLR